MPKLVYTPLASGFATVAEHNANLAAIAAALENTVSRNGTAPNTMTAPLDMNSQGIINLPPATLPSHPVTLAQYDAAASPSASAAAASAAAALVSQNLAAADVVLTHADVLLTNADVVTTTTNAANALASANAAAISEANAASIIAVIDALLVKDVSGAVDITLTAGEAANSNHEYTGILTGNINIIVPVTKHNFTVENLTTGAFTLTVKTLAGTGVLIPQNKVAQLYCNGVNVEDSVSIKANDSIVTAHISNTTNPHSVTAVQAGAVPITSSTGSSVIPTGNTAQRDITPSAGLFRFNTDLVKFEGYTGALWGSVGGGATGGGNDAVFVENEQVVTTDYTITAGKNAHSVGPITINTGITVTVPTGSTWAIS